MGKYMCDVHLIFEPIQDRDFKPSVHAVPHSLELVKNNAPLHVPCHQNKDPYYDTGAFNLVINEISLSSSESFSSNETNFKMSSSQCSNLIEMSI